MSRKTLALAGTLLSLLMIGPASSGPALVAGVGGFVSTAEQGVSEDLDARQGRVRPSAEQVAIAESLGAQVTWNDYGTPHSLSRHGGYLATGLVGEDAVAAARSFIEAHKALFRLTSTEGLGVHGSSRLEGSNGHAVTFRQTFGGLRAAEGGLLTVGLQGGPDQGWKVAYVSSTVTRDSSPAAEPRLSATDAWSLAAADVGRPTDASAIGPVKEDRGWSVFAVQGYSTAQRARLVAVPTPLDGVRPAYETLVVDSKAPTAFHHFIDAATGAVLVRKDLVEHSHPPGDFFSGQVPAVDGDCAPDNGPWTVEPGETVDEVQASAAAVLTTNDMVIHIVRDGAIVATTDTLFSPETVVYDPPDDGVGTYHVRVCDFVDGVAWDDPRDYSGQVLFSPAGTGTVSPYPPKWEVFPAYPTLGAQVYPWAYPSDDTRETWCWESTVGPDDTPIPECDREVQNLASRVPWDYDPRTNAPTFTTRGNNASSAESWFSPLTPGPTGFRPTSAQREYIYPWTSAWSETECLPVFTPGVTQDISAAAANLFAMHNRMHDFSYFLGFTERRWNAQDVNFGTGGTAERDPLLGDVQAGAATDTRDNANMIPLPDGVPPITNMYLWQPRSDLFYAPCVDGDFDMAVIGHEYGHLIESRMIGKGGGRSGHHAGAMGESFGDFDAAEYLNAYGFVPVSGENPFTVGAYVTADHERGIRNYNMSFPRTGAFPEPSVNPDVNPLNFSDMGYDIVGQQVHANGEIWSATNYDIRQALIDKYNAQFPANNQSLQDECADGKHPADQCPGNRRWIQLVYDAMLLMPPDTSMLEARDAYLAADQMRFGGANQAELWNVFATRGFGEDASSTNNSAEDAATSDTDPKPDFTSPLHDEATVTFEAVDGAGAPVDARIYVGHYEARVSPIADTDPATTASNNLDAVAGFVPGTYELVAHAPGHGHVRLRETLEPGTTTITFAIPTNVASGSNGATATGDGENHDDLIDDTEGTTWDFEGAPVGGQQVTVDLAGDGPVTVDRVNVSALLTPGEGSRFTALRSFRIDASDDGTNFDQVYTSPEDAFPTFNFRPIGPELALRSFDIPDVQATHLRIVALTNQCTGAAEFQGDQDADPTNDSDCHAAHGESTHIAELQAFGPAAPPEPAADLSITKADSPDPVQRGMELTYTINVTNDGPDQAEGVTVVDQLPKGAGFGSASSTQGTCGRPRKGAITCEIGSMASGQTVTIIIKIKPTDQGTITNRVDVTADSPGDPNTANNSDTEDTVVL
jgi:extracellular elastinolytic metalloproteinase